MREIKKDQDCLSNKKIEEIDNGLEKANEHFFIKSSIDQVTFDGGTKLLNKKKAELRYDILQIEGEDQFLKYSKFVFPFLTNLDSYYQNSTFQVKRFILGSMFPEKLYFSEKGYRTTKMNEVVALLNSADKGLELDINRQATKNRGLSTKARLIDDRCSLIPLTNFITIRKIKRLNFL